MEHQTPRLFIVDGMSLLFRSFYAMGSRLTSPDGTPIGAVFGFLKIILKILKEQNPTHFAVCWDLKEKTFRHEVFPLYKSNRGATPPDIIPQISLVKDLLTEMKVPSFSLPGYEADDIACAIAKYFEHYGKSYLVTLDKDYMQIINDNIFMVSLKKGDDYDIIDKEKVVDFFGVKPEQVVDVLGLTGDTSDFIPGVKGIGDKTAAKLINQFGSIENMYDKIDQVLNKRAKLLLEENKESALLSKYLATIKTDIPMNVTESSLRYSFFNIQKNIIFKEKLSALKMFNIIKFVYGNENKPTELNIQKDSFTGTIFENSNINSQIQTSIESHNSINENNSSHSMWKKRNYKLVVSKNELENVFAQIASSKTQYFALDTETTGLDIINDKPIGLCLCFEEGNAYYIPTHPRFLEGGSLLHIDKVIPQYTSTEVFNGLNEALKKRTALLVAQNLKFDLHQLKNVGVTLGDGPIACTMVAAWLCNPSESTGFSLDALTFNHLGLEKIPTSQLIGKETGRQSMLEVPLIELTEYGCEDADATFRLWNILSKNLEKNKELEKLFFEVEMPILKLLAKMERHGVHIDSYYLGELTTEVQTKLIEIESEVYNQVGFNFKLTSPKQLGDVLFETLKIHETLGYKGKLARTTLGYKTDAKVLEEFSEHPVVTLIQQHRELSKLLNTYILVLPKLVKANTGRVHTNFNQIGTATGRLSSSDPNLQNIPVRTNLGKKVRAAFTASKSDHCIISADYSQIELRVLAHLSNDQNMIDAFCSGADIHKRTAAQILGKNLEEVTPEERSKAKAINFGIIYGMGANRLAKEQKISLAEAKAFIEKYFLNFHRVKEYLDQQRQAAHELGVVKTFFGRIRPIPAMQSKNPLEAKLAENMAINAPIQGTAADIMKLGMLAVENEIKKQNLQAKILIQVHDELVLEAPISEKETITKILKDAMENAVSFIVPMVVEVGFGKNWLEAK
jgi:DNA polymerase-1